MVEEINESFSTHEKPFNIDNLSQSEQRRHKYLELQASRGDRSSHEYQELMNQVRRDTLSEIPEYGVLQALLRKPTENSTEIADLIKKVRAEFCKDPLFSRASVHLVTTSEEFNEYKQRQLEKNEQQEQRRYKASFTATKYRRSYVIENGQVKRFENRDIKKQPFIPREMRFPEYPATPQHPVQKLYHWVPDHLVERVMKQGLLPGFLAGDVTIGRTVVHTTFQKNEYWNQKMAQDKGKEFAAFADPGQYTLLEIDYDPSLEAYMWPPSLTKSADATSWSLESNHDPDYYKDAPLLSSRLVPLDAQVSLLLDVDLADAEKKESKGESTDNWVYSPILHRHLPPFSTSSSEAYDYSEVLLDYVPPSRIHVAKLDSASG